MVGNVLINKRRETMRKSKTQRQFEVFASQHYYFSELSVAFDDYVKEYIDCDIQNAWEIWQAACNSKVVKLPAKIRGIDETSRINNKAVDMLIEVLTEAEVKYK